MLVKEFALAGFSLVLPHLFAFSIVLLILYVPSLIHFLSPCSNINDAEVELPFHHAARCGRYCLWPLLPGLWSTLSDSKGMHTSRLE